MNTSKKILFLLTQDLESPSGLGRYFPLSKYLVKEGFSVTIAALHSNFSSLNNNVFSQEGVKVFYLAQMHVKKESNRTIYFNFFQLIRTVVKATWHLFFFVMKNNADIIVIGKPHPMNSIAGVLGGYLKGTRIILDCDDYEAASNYFSSKWQQNIIKFFENTTPRLVSKVTTNTLFNKERMISLGIASEKIHYLPNGVDQDRFKTNEDKAIDEIVLRLGLSDKKIVAYIGSLNLSNHPVDLLIKAFKLVIEKLDNVILIIVGGGRDMEILKELSIDLNINDKVIFEGRVPPEAVVNYYKIADVTVDPVYDTEAARGRCPLKMFESWLVGSPFITGDVGDRKVLAGIPPKALLTKPGDAYDLAVNIERLINDNELALELKNNGEKIIKDYYWESLVKKRFLTILNK